MNARVIKSVLILGIISFYIVVKAPMIVVQGSIQLWPVTIINNSNYKLVVIDEIIDPQGSSSMFSIINNVAPNNQFTFQWPSTFLRPNARRLTIYGKAHAVVPTNRIIIGNTPDATHPMIPSGDHIVISLSKGFIALADHLNPTQASGR